MKNLNLTLISKKELSEINGGNLIKALFSTLHYSIRYTSVTGAFLTGIVEGYYKDNK